MNTRNLLVLICNESTERGLAVSYLARQGYSVFEATSQEDFLRKLRTKTVHMICVNSAILSEELAVLPAYFQENSSVMQPLYMIASELTTKEAMLLRTFPGMKVKVERPLDINHFEKLLKVKFGSMSGLPGLAPDDDLDKPLHDPQDRISIEIIVRLKAQDSEEVEASLVEYAENSLLLDVGKARYQPEDFLYVSVFIYSPEGEISFDFHGKVLSVEEFEGEERLVLVDSSQVSGEFSRKVVRQLMLRQAELLKFMRKSQN
jgi:hypothetical protein